MVDVLVIHHVVPSPWNEELARIGAYDLDFDDQTEGSRVTTVRVRPGATFWLFGSDYSDNVSEQTTARETVASCRVSTWTSLAAGETYQIEYHFFGHANCWTRCVRRVRTAEGGFATATCEAPR